MHNTCGYVSAACVNLCSVSLLRSIPICLAFAGLALLVCACNAPKPSLLVVDRHPDCVEYRAIGGTDCKAGFHSTYAAIVSNNIATQFAQVGQPYEALLKQEIRILWIFDSTQEEGVAKETVGGFTVEGLTVKEAEAVLLVFVENGDAPKIWDVVDATDVLIEGRVQVHEQRHSAAGREVIFNVLGD